MVACEGRTLDMEGGGSEATEEGEGRRGRRFKGNRERNHGRESRYKRKNPGGEGEH